MQIREFSKPVTATKLNESLAKRFGASINIDEFTTEQLQDARNKVRTKVFNVETTESFDQVQKTDYSKNKMFLDVLNAALHERDDVSIAIDEAIEGLNEGEEDKAELVMAAKDMVDRVTGWMEDTAEMQAESMLELGDAIRDEMGQAESETFIGTVKPALESLYTALESTRAALTNGVAQITGEGGVPTPMGDEEPAMDAGMDAGMDAEMEPTIDAEDDFGGSEAAVGGEAEAGREKRESKIAKKKMIETSRRLGTILSTSK